MSDGAGQRYVQKTPSLRRGLSESGLVEQPAVDLFAALGWETANLLQEWSGASSSEGRSSKREVVLPHRLMAALRRLNPELPETALATAMEELTRDRSRLAPGEANREVHRLLLDGVKVVVTDEHGTPDDRMVRLIDWRRPEANAFFLGRQFWVAGDLYNRRCDLVGFVNGIPLVFIELKGADRALKTAYDENLDTSRNLANRMVIS